MAPQAAKRQVAQPRRGPPERPTKPDKHESSGRTWPRKSQGQTTTKPQAVKPFRLRLVVGSVSSSWARFALAPGAIVDPAGGAVLVPRAIVAAAEGVALVPRAVVAAAGGVARALGAIVVAARGVALVPRVTVAAAVGWHAPCPSASAPRCASGRLGARCPT